MKSRAITILALHFLAIFFLGIAYSRVDQPYLADTAAITGSTR